MKRILLLVAVVVLVGGFTVYRDHELKNEIVLRRWAVDPNGTMTLVYERAVSEPNDVTDYMPSAYQRARAAVLDLPEEMIQLLILDVQIEIEDKRQANESMAK